MTMTTEIREKEARIHGMLERLGYQSLLLTRRENFSWLTCGKRAVVSYITPESPVYLLVTPTKKYAIGYNMDVPRTMDEELGGQGFEPVSLPTYDVTPTAAITARSPLEAARELAAGRLAADESLPGWDNVEKEILKIHEPFTPDEMERYRVVAKEAAEIVHELANWVEPGMTERQVLGKMWGMYLEHDFEGNCMFVTADERISRYRHGIPGLKKIEKGVLLAPAVYKYGLGVALTRIVYFEEPPAEIRARMRGVMTLQASVVARTKPGMKLSSLLKGTVDLFSTLGYPEEQTCHFHGGPCGYRVSYPERDQDPKEEVHPNMAFAWYLCISGAKSEELILVTEKGAQIASNDPQWPADEIDIDGQKTRVHDILVRR